MTKTKKRARPERHYARYSGGLAMVKHNGRLPKIVPFTFTSRVWVEIPKDPYWQCKKCNKLYKKADFPKKPDLCGNKVNYMESIQGAIGSISGAGIARTKICENKVFTDTIQRRYFKGKAAKNPTWEYKIE